MDIFQLPLVDLLFLIVFFTLLLEVSSNGLGWWVGVPSTVKPLQVSHLQKRLQRNPIANVSLYICRLVFLPNVSGISFRASPGFSGHNHSLHRSLQASLRGKLNATSGSMSPMGLEGSGFTSQKRMVCC